MMLSTDAHRDRDDSSNKPYRVRYLDSGSCGIWSYIKDRNGNIKKFGSLRVACAAARALA
jgi:hypothetical protein